MLKIHSSVLAVFGFVVAAALPIASWAEEMNLASCTDSPKIQPSEPIYVSDGNGHMSGIYDSSEFTLTTSDERVFLFRRFGKSLEVSQKLTGKRSFECTVAHYGDSWGKSEMMFTCREGRGEFVSRDETYFYLSTEPTPDKTRFRGTLYESPYTITTDDPKRAPKEQKTFAFASVCHVGWRY